MVNSFKRELRSGWKQTWTFIEWSRNWDSTHCSFAVYSQSLSVLCRTNLHSVLSLIVIMKSVITAADPSKNGQRKRETLNAWPKLWKL